MRSIIELFLRVRITATLPYAGLLPSKDSRDSSAFGSCACHIPVTCANMGRNTRRGFHRGEYQNNPRVSDYECFATTRTPRSLVDGFFGNMPDLTAKRTGGWNWHVGSGKGHKAK